MGSHAERREEDRRRFGREFMDIRDRALSGLDELERIEQLEKTYTHEEYVIFKREPDRIQCDLADAMQRVGNFRHDIVNILPMKVSVRPISGMMEGIIGAEAQREAEGDALSMLQVVSSPKKNMRDRLGITIAFAGHMLGMLFPDQALEAIRHAVAVEEVLSDRLLDE